MRFQLGTVGNLRRGHRDLLRAGNRSALGDASEEDDDGALNAATGAAGHGTDGPIGPSRCAKLVGRSPEVALPLLLLKLVTDTFDTSSSSGSCLEASVRHVYMSAQAPT